MVVWSCEWTPLHKSCMMTTATGLQQHRDSILDMKCPYIVRRSLDFYVERSKINVQSETAKVQLQQL